MESKFPNGEALAELGGIFARLDLSERPLDIAFGNAFLEDPENCRFMGNIDYYGSDILSDYANGYKTSYKSIETYILHLDTFKFWWKRNQHISPVVWVMALKFEQYHIADKCELLDNFTSLMSSYRLNHILDMRKIDHAIENPDKFANYLAKMETSWVLSSLVRDFPKNVATSMTKNKKHRITADYDCVPVIINKGWFKMLNLVRDEGRKVEFKEMVKFDVKLARKCMKYQVKVIYKEKDVQNMLPGVIEVLLEYNTYMPFDGHLNIWYDLETLRRKLTGDTSTPQFNHNGHYNNTLKPKKTLPLGDSDADD